MMYAMLMPSSDRNRYRAAAAEALMSYRPDTLRKRLTNEILPRLLSDDVVTRQGFRRGDDVLS